MRCEITARARPDRHGERHRNRQRPHGIRFRLLLPGDGEHPFVHSALHHAGGHTGGGSADRARGVHAQQRFPGCAQGIGHVQLGHHHALEHVRGLADDDRVDIGHGQVGVGQCPVDRLAAHPGHGDIAAFGNVVGLSGAQHRGGETHRRASESRTVTRFCCRAGPLVACARVRFAVPEMMGSAA